MVGIIDDVGPDVDARLHGRRVLVDPALYDDDGPQATPGGLLGSERDGGFAGCTVADADRVHDVTHSPLSDDQLPALPVAYGTAMGMLDRAGVTAGQQVLVTGASGGVGLATVQLASRIDARVVALTTAATADAVGDTGADVAIDRRGDVPAHLADGLEVSLDAVEELDVPVAATHALDDVHGAQARLLAGGTVGKVVVRVGLSTDAPHRGPGGPRPAGCNATTAPAGATRPGVRLRTRYRHRGSPAAAAPLRCAGPARCAWPAWCHGLSTAAGSSAPAARGVVPTVLPFAARGRTMAVTDEARRALFTKLVGVLGEADAVTLIDQLPPSGETMVTKSHLDARLDALEQRMEHLEQRMEQFEQRLEERLDTRLEAHSGQLRAEMQALHARSVRVFVTALVLSNATIAGLVFAATG